MSTPENVARLEAARDEWNAGRLDGYLRLYAPVAIVHGYAGVEPGIAGIRQFYQGFWAAFPGSQLVFEDIFAAEDRVACRFVVQATHGGLFHGVAATGRRVELPGLTILRFADGQCVERWTQADFLGLFGQLGAPPAPA